MRDPSLVPACLRGPHLRGCPSLRSPFLDQFACGLSPPAHAKPRRKARGAAVFRSLGAKRGRVRATRLTPDGACIGHDGCPDLSTIRGEV